MVYVSGLMHLILASLLHMYIRTVIYNLNLHLAEVIIEVQTMVINFMLKLPSCKSRKYRKYYS